jgi:CRP-like cAMP-binding protein
VAALHQNFTFSTLTEEDMADLMISMEIVDVSPGENIITQGQDGEYFYIIEQGTFTVLVDDKPVSTMTEGNSFGELALLYNAPRQATIRADTAGSVFSLDRETYRFTLAQSANERNTEIKKALAAVTLLADLTDEQLEKVSDAVEIFPYKAGTSFIQSLEVK